MLPSECEHAATSQLTAFQVFRHGRASYGLRVHLEPGRRLVAVILAMRCALSAPGWGCLTSRRT